MKDLSYLTLLDIYGSALTEKQRDMLSCYYERDFSLSEIADNYGISRQAVHAAIRQAEDGLTDCEIKFGIRAFVRELKSRLSALQAECAACGGQADRAFAELDAYIRSVYGSIR